MHWNLGQIYLHLKFNTKLTTLPTLCDTGKLEYPRKNVAGLIKCAWLIQLVHNTNV